MKPHISVPGKSALGHNLRTRDPHMVAGYLLSSREIHNTENETQNWLACKSLEKGRFPEVINVYYCVLSLCATPVLLLTSGRTRLYRDDRASSEIKSEFRGQKRDYRFVGMRLKLVASRRSPTYESKALSI